MWYLQEFDNETELRTKIYLLHDMTVEIVKDILGIDDNDFELPIVAGQSGVPLDKVAEFAMYIQEPMEVNPNCEYEVSFLAE